MFMERLLVATAALNQTPIDWENNLRNIRGAIAAARRAGAQIVCLPELCITGYGCEDTFHSSGILEQALRYTVELAKESKGIIVNVGLPLELNGAVYNVVALLANGEIAGFVAKQHLAGDGIHYEPRWFKPWPRGVVSHIQLGKQAVPVGDIFFEVDGVRIGFEICEDAWVADRPGIDLARHGVDIVLNPSASHFSFGKHEVRKRFVLEGSRAFGVAYIYANLLGCEAGRVIYDGDTIICSHGEIVALGERFSFEQLQVVSGVIDLERSRMIRRRLSSFRPQHDVGNRLVVITGLELKRSTKSSKAQSIAWEGSETIKQEEFTRAVSLGLLDYLRKSRSEGFVVSLSGGVDSSAASCLVRLMIEGALKELGLAGLKAKLSYIPGIKRIKNVRELTKRLLACVYQGSDNSSETTATAASTLAKELGAEFFNLSIAELVDSYEKLISKATGVKLSWQEHDIARQNIQARVRSPSVWLIANLRRALLLTTSNRSEAAVGYTTMDGDSSGGLSPLGGIDKAFLREWLKWLESQGPAGLSSFPALALVNVQAPTAELRPARDKQTDERDLMPYEVLDIIERYAVRDKLLPQGVLELLREDFAGRYSLAELSAWTERFFKLWSANQWKRERYAPSFHLDDENLDPKSWCRFPILSGGFAQELKGLRSKKGRR